MDQRAAGQQWTPSHEPAWVPTATVAKLRQITSRYLDGDGAASADVETVADSLAAAAHSAGHSPERMLIAVREIWREFTPSQHDRLQLASLYDRLVRRTIDRYYDV
ncbi:MAG TPA: hypothetical protein VGH98_01030 [Gemmatimonadaceae bacterium]|jgi:hypothetical protein